MNIFPEVDARSLLGEELGLPADLPARRTVVIAAFLREQQEEVDRWINALEEAGLPHTTLGLDETAQAAVIEIPVLPSRNRMARRLIDGGMSRKIGVKEVLARTWTVYTDVEQFRKTLDIPTPRVEVMVVSRLGEVVDRAHGEPSELTIQRLVASALETVE